MVDAALRAVDGAILDLITGLKGRGLWERTDLLIVSDHGMTAQPHDRLVAIEELLQGDISQKIAWADYGPVASIIPRDGQLENVYGELTEAIRERGLPMRAYLRDQIPERYQYRKSQRIADITVECELGWSLTLRGSSWIPGGQHGYDPELPDMWGLFLASGPSFIKNSSLPIQNSLDVYPLLGDLLGLELLPQNATHKLCQVALCK